MYDKLRSAIDTKYGDTSMKTAGTLGQYFSLFAILADNTDWSSLDSNTLRRLIDKDNTNPRQFGQKFTKFLLKEGQKIEAPNLTFKNSLSRKGPRKSPLSINFAQIKSVRITNNLTLQQLANMTNLSIGYISQIENGNHQKISEDAIDRIARALGVTPKDIISKTVTSG